MKRLLLLLAAALAAAGTLVGCSSDSSDSANTHDQQISARQLGAYQASQPIPQGNWSQYRQTLIDVENAEITGVATTTFFYNMGSSTPVKSCPSIGFPVASTAQLSNPLQIVQDRGQYAGGNQTIPQLEPNGVFTGASSGTYVVCVLPDGTKQIDYWEGFVETEGGSAHLDGNGQIVSDTSTVVSTDQHR